MQVAIIIDWDNIKRRIFDKKGFPPEFSYRNHENLSKFLCFFKSFLEEYESLYRIFFYTAKPYDKNLASHFEDLPLEITDEIKQKILRKSENISHTIKKFLSELGKQDYIALRLGTLSFEGWDISKSPPQPKFKQKKVDMLMGLDIAHLAYKKLVQRILLFSYDTDIQPALKVARIEGLQVILPVIDESYFENPPEDLLKHSDIVRVRSLEDIKKSCNK